MNENLFITLVAKKLAGEASAQELQELDTLLQAHEHLRERYAVLRQYFEEHGNRMPDNAELALQRTLSRIRQQPGHTPTPRLKERTFRHRGWMLAGGMAATVLVLLGLFFLLRRPQPAGRIARAATDTAHWQNRQNGKATKAILELTDGSKIWLNADSRLTYPEVFTGGSREVYLEGEAFFEVANNPTRPFIIHLRKGTIKVLGTSFNIRAYENEPVQTSVTTGKVAFIPKYEAGSGKKPDTILITPDVKVTFSHSTGNIVKENTTSEDDKAWTEGRLVFRNATLETIGMELERAFGKKVRFAADAPRHYRLTGSFRQNSLQEIMYYLARSRPFRYEITDSTLVINE
ncbi:FecR domain-containing protein [Chitinophaga japonensis]|uniref:FecR family protein n=1 Tax=Chitinophaga japonensis TaxID=104662 RepID=A0A562T6I6_CHIJA|nr:FecR domain-containing protein [Chitinophaga japonensis]TWI89161.1 FecR family protein [Chitinophaga japonensis]